MLDELKSLQEEKGKIVAEQRSVIDAAEKAGRSEFTPEERSQFDKHDSRIAFIDRKIEVLQQEEAAKRSVAEKALQQQEETRSAENTDANTAARKDAFRAYLRYGFSALKPEERSLLGGFVQTTDNPVNERAQSSTGSAGGYTIPREFSGEMDKALKAFGGMLQLGRTWTTGTGATVDWPTFDDTANAGYILGENADATTGSTDLAFGQKQLGAFLYTTGVIKVPNTLMQDTAFDLDALINEAFATRFGRIQSTHLTTGNGTTQPQGVVTGATAVTGAAATALTADNIIDLIHSVDPAYRAAPGVALTFNDLTLAAIRKLKDNQGQYIWQMGNIQTGIPSSVFGYQYVINQDLANIGVNAKTVGFGDFKRYIIRRVQDILVRRLEERYAEMNQVGFVAFARMDARLLNANAVKFIQHAAS